MRRLQSRSGIGAASLGVEVVANDLKIVEETTSNSIGKLSNG
jgi:hypothetical protein